jgi:serine protease Do
MGFMPQYFTDSILLGSSMAYDFCVFYPISKLKKNVDFLKIGNMDSVREGQEIYTCGYPLGYPIQFVSKGILSTKYMVSSPFGFPPRKQALLDLTLNKGNSGGAILYVGNAEDDDKVIGIADFIINPLGAISDSITTALKKIPANNGIEFNVITENGKVISRNNPNMLAEIFSQALGSSSIGVSGCVSINHLVATLNAVKK